MDKFDPDKIDCCANCIKQFNTELCEGYCEKTSNDNCKENYCLHKCRDFQRKGTIIITQNEYDKLLEIKNLFNGITNEQYNEVTTLLNEWNKEKEE